MYIHTHTYLHTVCSNARTHTQYTIKNVVDLRDPLGNAINERVRMNDYLESVDGLVLGEVLACIHHSPRCSLNNSCMATDSLRAHMSHFSFWFLFMCTQRGDGHTYTFTCTIFCA